ncbi:group II intron maturase-specific domain-containing protein [Bradyrhizobium sp. USDA 4518]
MRATKLAHPPVTPGTLAEIAQQINPLLPGWIGYYGRFSRSALLSLGRLRQSEAEGVDHAKVQAFSVPQSRCFAVLPKVGSG